MNLEHPASLSLTPIGIVNLEHPEADLCLAHRIQGVPPCSHDPLGKVDPPRVESFKALLVLVLAEGSGDLTQGILALGIFYILDKIRVEIRIRNATMVGLVRVRVTGPGMVRP